MKRTALLLLILISNFLLSQIQEVKDLWKINKKYDSILIDYQKRAKDSLSKHKKKERQIIMSEGEDKIIKKKHKLELELLDKIKKLDENQQVKYIPSKTKNCDFIGREILAFNKKLKNSYKPTAFVDKSNNPNNQPLKTILTFTVSEDGYISNVKAIGSDENFNNENVLTLYKIGRWTPKCVNGFTETAKFRMPITMKFE